MKTNPKLEAHHINVISFCTAAYVMHNKVERCRLVIGKKYNLDDQDVLRCYWHDFKQEENKIFSQNFGESSMMVWVGFSQAGNTALALLGGKQKADDYQLMLEDNLLPYAPLISGKNWVFQQDNTANIFSKKY